MADVEGRCCIDKWEASLVEIGSDARHSPFTLIGNKHVRAVSEPKVYPQGYVSAVEASRACIASGKRLCRLDEWRTACRGPQRAAWGYGDKQVPRRCNDHARNPGVALYG